MEKAKCKKCGKILEKQDMIYQVRIIESDGVELYVPSCSIECAYAVKQRYIKIHISRWENMHNQDFQYMTVENFGTQYIT